MDKPRQRRVVVVGAGVNGMSSAVRIQQLCGDEVQVTVVAEKFSPNTTSDVAGGFWGPHRLGDTDAELIRQWSTVTHEYLLQLANSSFSRAAGVHVVSGYWLSSKASYLQELDEEYPWMESVVLGQRPATRRELDMFPAAKAGHFATTVKVDTSTYLSWLMEQFKANGGAVRQAKLNSLSELYGQYDIVVNCCGIGARHLLGDTEVKPVSGQVLKVRAPWIKQYFIIDCPDAEVYVFPGADHVTIGGTEVEDDWDAKTDEEVARAIWERAVSVYPQLKGAEFLSSKKGLRPCRTSIRLEPETVTHENKRVRVIHNYGHGGAGVTLHWGCAETTAKHVAASLLPLGLAKL